MNTCPYPETCCQGQNCSCYLSEPAKRPLAGLANTQRARSIRLLLLIAIGAWGLLIVGILGSCGLLTR